MNRAWHRWALFACLGMPAGCGPSLVRLEARGEHQRVREEGGRRRVHGKEARALARAWEEGGDISRARDILGGDVRLGGDVESLEALADLELRHGLRATAAWHFARLVELRPERLRERDALCELFVERAWALSRVGEGGAALAAMRVAELPCGGPARDAAALESSALEAARAEVRAKVAQTLCAGSECAPVDPEVPSVARTLERALVRGPRPTLLWTRRLEASLPTPSALDLILADVRGELEATALSDHELRRLLAGRSWGELAAEVMGRPTPDAAYLQLRLSSFMPDVPGRPEGPFGRPQSDDWIRQALDLEGIEGWRVFAERGDLVSAELELSRHRPPVSGGDALHWSARVEVGGGLDGLMFRVARLRALAGYGQLGLRLTMHRLSGLVALDPDANLAVSEPLRLLGWGRPWQALAVAEAGGVPSSVVAAAAATALRLERAVCGGPCSKDDDERLTESVLGVDWIARMEDALPARARSSRSPGRIKEGCPTAAEWFEPDASGRVAGWLVEGAEAGPPDLSRRWVRAIESEPALACGIHLLGPLALSAGYSVEMERLSDLLAFGAPPDNASEASAAALVALIARDPERAWSLAERAAGLADDPVGVWRPFIAAARWVGDPDLERSALHAWILGQPGGGASAAREELLLRTLLDVRHSWAERQTEVGREATVRHVVAELDALAQPRRWAARGRLAERMSERGDPSAAALAIEALFPTPELRTAHRVHVALLEGEDPVRGGSWLDDVGLAAEVRSQRRDGVPPATELVGDPARFERFRGALASGVRDWSTRRRFAASVAAFGSRRARAMAVAALLEIADAPGRQRLASALLDGLVAAEPTAGGVREAMVVDDPALVIAALWGLDLSSVLVAG